MKEGCFTRRWDLDELFSYSTGRIVRIRDRRLGGLYYFALLLVFAYIVVYNIIIQQSYRQNEEIVGSVRLNMLEPEQQLRLPPTDLPYCGNGTYRTSSGLEAPQLQCRYWDNYFAVYPRIEATASFLTTRVTETFQVLNRSECFTADKYTCSYSTVDNETLEFYIPQAELFTLRIDHSITVPSVHQSYTSRRLHGEILDPDGNRYDPCHIYEERGIQCPEYVASSFSSGAYDTFPIEALLEAAGTPNLEVRAAERNTKLGKETARFAGTVLTVNIHYSNFHSYNPYDVKYTYTVRRVQDTEFKGEQELSGENGFLQGDRRTIIDRHGVRVVVVQSARIGYFNAQALLIQLVSSVGLLAVAKFITDFLAFRCCTMRYIYRQYQTVQSVDFSDIEHLPLTQLNRFKSEDLINPRPLIFEGIAADKGEALTAGADPAASRLHQAPVTGHSVRNVGFASTAANFVRSNEDDSDDESLQRRSVHSARSSASPTEVELSPRVSTSRSRTKGRSFNNPVHGVEP